MGARERDALEHAVRVVAEKAAEADRLVDEAGVAGRDGSHPVAVGAKMLRQELLQVKADLERELVVLIPNCSSCGLDVHWVSGLGVTPGHWAHREPATHGKPVVLTAGGCRPCASWSSTSEPRSGPRYGVAKGTVVGESPGGGIVAPGIGPRVWVRRDRASIKALRQRLRAGETLIIDVSADEIVRTEP